MSDANAAGRADDSDAADACRLCGLPTPDPPVTDADAAVEGEFCCRGCLEVARTLDAAPEAVDASRPGAIRAAVADATRPADADARPDDGRDAGEDASPPADAAEDFLAVEGMHCATCEAFLEGRAAAVPAVHDAEANYASDLLRVVHDDETTVGALAERIGGLGYRVRPVDAPAPDDDESVGRLLVGGFFGMMTMLWYVLFLYPTYLGVDPSSLLLDASGPAGAYLLANIWVMSGVVLFYTGFPVLRGAYVSLRAGVPNMDLLVALAALSAYAYSTVALLIGRTEVYFDVAVVVVLAVAVGNYYEGRVKRRATGRLADLARERVETARLKGGDGVETVPVEELSAGDEAVVRAGERVPADGEVIEGTATVDEALVTGESLPVEKGEGEDAVGGSRVVSGALTVRVSDASTLDRIVSRLWRIQSSGAGPGRLADRLAAAFVPLVGGLALLAVGWHLLAGADPTAAFLTGVTVLVVSCPCALGLATPLAVAAGVRAALDRGVVVTDGSAFERAASVDVVALDKTGTLTTGDLAVVEAAGEEEALARAAAVEGFVDHPVAAAIAAHVAPPDAPVEDVERVPHGASALIDGERVLVGHPDLFDGHEVPGRFAGRAADARAAGAVPTYVGWDGAVRGVLVAADRPRPEWEAVVERLATDARVVVLTGDGAPAAARFREHPAVDETFADLPPEGKVETVERLRARGTVAMVGDGINDAPALAAADLGIAVGGAAALATDAADAVVTVDDLGAVPDGLGIMAATRGRVRTNLGWALCYNAIAVPLAFAGVLNPLLAAVAMATSSLLVVGNSTRSLSTGDAATATSDADGRGSEGDGAADGPAGPASGA
ncbi:MAG: heavy metal translocating P-type ATPase [Haloferacaceae archaeon]